MSRVREAIEEMIEESYLVGLSAEEIRQDFKDFIDTCYAVIHDNVRDRRVVSTLAESLAREQTLVLIADRASGVSVGVDLRNDSPVRSTREVFAEKVARRKRQILKTIAHHDPHLVQLIDARRFQGEVKEVSRPRVRRAGSGCTVNSKWETLRSYLLKVAYGLTIGLIIFLIYLGFVHRP